MAVPNNISTVTIQALVIRENNEDYIDYSKGGAIVGKVMPIPCRNVNFHNQNGWAIPVKDVFVSGLQLTDQIEDLTNQPTYDSVQVFCLVDKFSTNFWWVLGTYQDYFNSCSTCCGATQVPMPDVTTGIDIRLAPRYNVTGYKVNGYPATSYTLQFASADPTVSNVIPRVAYNNVEVTGFDSGGYSSISSMVSDLNTLFGSAESGAVTLVWSSTYKNSITVVISGSGVANTDTIDFGTFVV